MKDTDMQVVAGVGTLVLTAAFGLPAMVFASGPTQEVAKADNMEMIEASLAVKKTKVTQPQKPVHAPDPVKTEGVSHDDKKPPPDEPKKKDEPEKKPNDDKAPDLSKFHHSTDDDTPAGKPITSVGQFDGSDFGNAEVSKGDPYLQKLLADMHYAPPELAKGNGVPVGCIHLQPDGKVIDTKFQTKTDDDLQTAAEAALRELVKIRTENPVEVPTHLLQLTTKWLCFHFNVSIK